LVPAASRRLDVGFVQVLLQAPIASYFPAKQGLVAFQLGGQQARTVPRYVPRSR